VAKAMIALQTQLKNLPPTSQNRSQKKIHRLLKKRRPSLAKNPLSKHRLSGRAVNRGMWAEADQGRAGD
jgi:hypothetical protein